MEFANDILILKTEISNFKKENYEKIYMRAKVHLILIPKTEISNLKKETDQQIKIISKVHLQELDNFKQKNNILTKKVKELEKRLASQDIDISDA